MLVGVDGTGSKDWLPKVGHSHVSDFVRDYAGPAKYIHGPELLGGGMEEAIDDGVSWIVNNLRTRYQVETWCTTGWQCVADGEDTFEGARYQASLTKNQLICEGPSADIGPLKVSFTIPSQEPVNLVGHSRGGVAVIEIAKRLQDAIEGAPIPVNFIGLFDAVDRALWHDGEKIPANVRHAYHALRDPDVGSRSSFGNDGTKVENANRTTYTEKLFFGTHGAMGGDPVGGDRTYEDSRYIGMNDSVTGCKSVTLIPSKYVVRRVCTFDVERVSLDKNREASLEAARWMRSHARRHGIHFL